jgi:hypothetical protein
LNYSVAEYHYRSDLTTIDENHEKVYSKEAFNELMRRFFERGAMKGENLPVVENVDYS